MSNIKVKLIFNPLSGADVSQIERALTQANLDCQVEVTRYSKHAIELAEYATKAGYELIIAAGGDGLMNEVVNGILRAEVEPLPKVGLIPLGTANDLADALKIPHDLVAVAQRIAAGKTRLLDVCEVNGHYFVNNSGVGLEAAITYLNDKIRWVKGRARYLAAAVQGVWQFKPWEMRLDWPGGSYEGPITLVSIGNSARTGGGFYLTPQAEPDDGLLDFVFGTWLSWGQVVLMLPQTLYGGHIHHSLVIYKQTTSLKITVANGTVLHADGEILAENATEINYRIIPQKLAVIV